jgi:hypothetical protein
MGTPAGRSSGAVRHLPALRARLLPRGALDLLLQFLVLAAAYYAWRYARGAVDGNAATSFAHARDLISAERSLHLLFEPSLQGWAIDAGWPAEVARWGYANLHFRVGCLSLLTIYFWRPGSFPFVRNTVIAAMAISVIGYALYPTAPPRFIASLGMDPSAAVTGNHTMLSSPGDPWFNPFAAVPSMHVGLAIVVGFSLAQLSRGWALKVIGFGYPVLMTFIVLTSGNHFWLDLAFGALTAALAWGVATLLARVRPRWSFRAGPEIAPLPGVEPQPEAAVA